MIRSLKACSRAIVVLALSNAGCASVQPLLDDGSDASDATATGRDAAECPTLYHSYCNDHGYGTPCDVPCSYPPACTFAVVVRFSGPCCVENDVGYGDCTCVSGIAQCAPRFGAGPREAPTASCMDTCLDAGDTGRPDGG